MSVEAFMPCNMSVEVLMPCNMSVEVFMPCNMSVEVFMPYASTSHQWHLFCTTPSVLNMGGTMAAGTARRTRYGKFASGTIDVVKNMLARDRYKMFTAWKSQ